MVPGQEQLQITNLHVEHSIVGVDVSLIQEAGPSEEGLGCLTQTMGDATNSS